MGVWWVAVLLCAHALAASLLNPSNIDFCFLFEGNLNDVCGPLGTATTTVSSGSATPVYDLGVVGSALQFLNNRKVLAGTVNPTGPSISVSAWFFADTALPVTDGRIIEKGGVQTLRLLDCSTSKCLRCMFKTDGVNRIADSTAVPLDTWVFAACVYDSVAGTVTLYVDGAFVSSTAAPGTLGVNGNNIVIGNTNADSGPWTGMLDEIVVWKVALTSADVSELYGCGRGNGFLQPLATAVGDPSFTGFHGQQFQVHGEPASVYSLITSSDFQLNALFDIVETLPPFENCVMTYVGFLVRQPGGTLSINVDSAGSVYVNSNNISMIQSMSPSHTVFGDVHLVGGHGLKVQHPQFSVFVVPNNFSVVVRDEKNNDTQHYPPSQWLDMSVSSHLPVDSLPHLHGILGQTVQPWPTGDRTVGDPFRFIEGGLEDYLVAEGDVVGVDFKYNLFH